MSNGGTMAQNQKDFAKLNVPGGVLDVLSGGIRDDLD